MQFLSHAHEISAVLFRYRFTRNRRNHCEIVVKFLKLVLHRKKKAKNLTFFFITLNKIPLSNFKILS